ncbi:MAG TPA: HAMP domain-containing sensor histidine kinase [Candidatus Limnocylindrales bacterium]
MTSASNEPPGRPGRPGRPPWAPRGRRPPWWPADEAWPPRGRRHARGFGCLFALVVLVAIVGLLSMIGAFAGAVVSAPGPGGHALRFATALVILLLVAGVARASRSFRRSAIVLDELVDQAARLESGDYAARVAATGREPRPVADLVRGFNTMAARLEANERQRRTLIADVTHELRTPLTVIAGNVEAILDGIHPADDAHLGAILEETRVLRRLVEDLRTLALSEAGSLSLHREPTDLEILCNDVATSFAAAAEAGRVTIEATVADDVPLLDVDPVRIREVLGNLVANALRHTPSGGSISIRATRAPGAGSGGGERDRTPQNAARAAGAAVEIVVQDTGSGIEPALLPHVFDRFARGAGSTGTGLGLSIARGLVELHGGSIAASSPPAGGTAITIRLPVGGR